MNPDSHGANETPRTDEVVFRAVAGQHPVASQDSSRECVPADFARQLERELAEAKDNLFACRTALDCLAPSETRQSVPSDKHGELIRSLRWHAGHFMEGEKIRYVLESAAEALSAPSATAPLTDADEELAEIFFQCARYERPSTDWKAALAAYKAALPSAVTETESQYCPKCGGTKGHWEGCTVPNIPSIPAEERRSQGPSEEAVMLAKVVLGELGEGTLPADCLHRFAREIRRLYNLSDGPSAP